MAHAAADGDRAASAPPSPPPPRPPLRSNTGNYPAVTEDDAARALRISLATRSMVGQPPDGAKKGDKGSGLWERIVGIEESIDHMGADIGRVLGILDADAAKRTSAAAVASRVIWRIVETLLPVAVLAGLAYLAGFHR